MVCDLLKDLYGLENPYQVLQEIYPLELPILLFASCADRGSERKRNLREKLLSQCMAVVDRVIEELWLQDQPAYTNTYQRSVPQGLWSNDFPRLTFDSYVCKHFRKERGRENPLVRLSLL